ncbi:flagellin [Oleiphilus sp. HI0086]|uniref:flagellin N-terminal helical domain-containing protein n=1 Tax=Oleiphilus sp. HI0086 TaxID=1822260 RepID=UPI0007C33BD3|nr:flagellin [Oleiphilus sp. HI0086]KZZ31574.1 flagellin [Oleiphilus sp. HI0086]
MPQIINTNIASINAQRNLDNSQSANQTALQRLSSGLRINSAKDDAAGLAISTRFDSQVRGLNVAIRNAGDGVSLSQTAEGALGSITNNLLRIRDLALQSANGTNSAIDRQALDQEVQQLKAEIERVSLQTNFNGTNLLDGSFSGVTFQIGSNEGESVTVSIEGATVDKLGAAQTDGVSSDQQGGTTQAIAALAAGDLVINGIAVGASSGVDDAFSSADRDKSAIAKAAAINKVADITGIEAKVGSTSVSGGEGTFDNAASSGQIAINGVDIDVAASNLLSDEANLQNIANAINEKSGQTGVVAAFNGRADTGISLSAEDGRNIELAIGTTAGSITDLTDVGLAGAATYSGSFSLVSSDGRPIEIDTTSGDIENAGLAVGKFSGTNSGAIGQAVTNTTFVTGDLVINSVPVGPTLAAFDTASPSSTNPETSAIAKAHAINLVSDQSGVTATVNSTLVNSAAIAAPGVGIGESGSFLLNGVTIEISTSDTNTVADKQNTIISAINNKAGQTGIRAEALGSEFRLIADDGRNIDVGAFTGITPANIGLTASTEYRASISLQSAGKIELDSITGDIEKAGFEIGTYGAAESGQLVQDIDISTSDGAILALAAVDNALTTINFQRANLGAIQNRFESTITNQAIAAENFTEASSRIRDADFAAETAELSRSQVLQSAGLSILSQANGQPQQVLQLLQG